MIHTLAIEAVYLTSLPKIIVCAALLFGWGKWAAVVDKDTSYYNLNRRMWNMVQLAAGVAAFLAVFFLPWFFVGLPLGLLIIGGGAFAYVRTRNAAVPEGKQWHLDTASLTSMFSSSKEDKAAKKTTIRFVKPPQGYKPVPDLEDPQHEIHLSLEQILEAALRKKAQRIDMAASESQFICQMSVDGVDQRLPAGSVAAGIAMLDYLKGQSGMDVADRRKKQLGKCRIETDEHGSHELKVSTAGSTRGITANIVIDPVKQLTIAFDQLGFLDSQVEALKPVFATTKGVVLVASPSRQGRTTTFYNMLLQHDAYTMDIHVFEPETERELEGITHNVTDTELKRKIESLLLRDPHVVGLANLTDPEVAQTIARASTEDKRFYAGLKADDTFTALKIWVKALGDLELASKSLSAIIAQRLLRKLCDYCKQKYKPDPEVLRKYNLPADKIHALYKASGRVIIKKEPEPCPVCGGSGYQGRFAAYEVMVIDDEARQFIKAGRLEDLRAHLRRRKMMWLGEAALSRAVSGATSISEVGRAMGQEQETAATA